MTYKIVYLSGPVSLGGTATEEQISEFSEVFMSAQMFCKGAGIEEVINPVECEKQDNWEDYMKVHIPSVCRSDLVMTLPQAIRSRGSVLEIFIAHQLKIPVISYLEAYNADRNGESW